VDKDVLHNSDRVHVDGLSGKDEATLSERARMLAKARTNLADAADVRTDVVEGLRQQIQDGVYQIPYDTLAQRLLAAIKGG
jgi:flagellar biosynthesis anti-sigma factor FlgM